MPPWEEIRDPLKFGLLLPLAVSGIVYFAFSRITLRRGIALAGLLAIVAGFFAGNDQLGAVVKFRIDHERALDPGELMDAGYRAVMGIEPRDKESPKISAQYWLPWVALLAGLAGLIRRPGIVAWPLAIAVSILAARLIVRADLRAEVAWLWPTLAAAVLVEWKVIEAAGRKYPGVWLPLGIGFAFLTAAGVIVHAHSASLGFIATIFAGCWLGIAAASRRIDGGATAPLAAVLLPSIMVIAQQNTYSDVPLTSFILVALSPLALVFVLIPRRSSPRMIFAGLALLLLANAVAMGLAAQAESISVD